MQYLWQYYLLIGIILIQGLVLIPISKQSKNIFLLLCFAEFSFLAGFRDWEIGNDTINYVNTFRATIAHLSLLYSHMEIGYLCYNRFLAFFTSNPQVILIVNALIITGGFFYFFKKYSSAVLLSVLLFSISHFAGTMNVMREYLAIAIVIFSFHFVIKRQFLPFLIACLIAATFHTSAVLALSLYFLYDLPFKTKYLFYAFLGTFIGVIFLAPILDNVISITGRYGSYQGNILLGEETKIASLFKVLIQVIILIFCCFSYRYVYKPNAQTKPVLPVQFLLWMSVCSTCVYIVSIRGTVLERLAMYFYIFSLISIPFFVHCYSKRARILVSLCLLGCFILYNSIIFIYRPNWNYVLPFKFCF